MKEDTKKHGAPKADAPSTEVAAARGAKEFAPLPESATLREVIARVNELSDRGTPKRDRGPSSTREMTDADAELVILGDMKAMSHTKAAEALGLSYGQVYSARKGFTFKGVYQRGEKAKRETK